MVGFLYRIENYICICEIFISVVEENLEIIKYVSNTLSNLRDMLTDYINSVYKTKSYIENLVNYNKFLAVLNGISDILEEMNKKGE